MISFRFHLVSLVAVFLALGLGVLTGTTVLNRGIVAQLDRQTDELTRQSEQLRAELERLRAESQTWSVFGEEVASYIGDDRLSGTDVVMVSQEGSDDEMIASVRRALERSGAQVSGLLSVGERMALPDESAERDLESIVGVPAGDETLQEEAAEAVAARLAFGPTAEDVLGRLLQGEFMVSRGPGMGEAALRSLGGNGEAVVVVGNWSEPSDLGPEEFLVPLVSDLVTTGVVPVAAAEGMSNQEPLVAFLRSDPELAESTATVDNADQVPGQIGLVVALEDLLGGTPGHYGMKDGVAAFLPDL